MDQKQERPCSSQQMFLPPEEKKQSPHIEHSCFRGPIRKRAQAMKDFYLATIIIKSVQLQTGNGCDGCKLQQQQLVFQSELSWHPLGDGQCFGSAVASRAPTQRMVG